PQLDYEREEDAMLRATGALRGSVVVHFAETGTIEELAQLVARCRPHVVHLSGHGDLDAEGNGVFAFEDEDGRTDPRDAREIAAEVTRGGSVRLMILNACKTSQAAAAGLCQSLAAAGVPLALGWAASVEDEIAIRFVTS